jgi:hypothetical protein
MPTKCLRQVTASACIASAMALLAACAGLTTDGGGSGGSGASSNGGIGCTEPPQHRPVASVCPLHSTSGVACSGPGECDVPDAGPYASDQPHPYCLHGSCGIDECLTDADCPSGNVCACAGNLYGQTQGSGTNVCVPATCHVDSDCGACGYCSPSAYPGCSPIYGASEYACHKPGDACYQDSTCGAQTGSIYTDPYCAWNPMNGGWSCTTGFCGG